MKPWVMLRCTWGLAILSCTSTASKLGTSNGQISTEGSGKEASATAAGCKAFKCSDGWFPKDFFPKTDHVDDETCCVKTCKLWNCSAGFVANELYQSNVQNQAVSNDQVCCDKQCGEWQCDVGYLQTKEKQLAPGLTHEECCEKLCEGYSCTGNWSAPPNQPTIFGNSSEVCCEPSCATFNCTDGWVPDPSKFDRVAVDTETCCQQSCAMRGCPAGFKVPASKAADPANSSCCDPTCGAYICSYGWQKHPDPNKSLELGFTDEECCVEVHFCADYACDPSIGWANSSQLAGVPVPEDNTSNIDETCCAPTCYHHNCSGGLVLSDDPDKLNGADQSDEDCCETPCSNHVCHERHMLMSDADKIPGNTDEKCCEPKKCSAVKCSASMPKKPESDNVTGWTEEECCEPQVCSVIRSTMLQVGPGGCNSLTADICSNRFFEVEPENRSRIVVVCKVLNLRGAIACTTEGEAVVGCGDMGSEHGMHCSVFMCPYGKALKENAADIYGDSPEACCE